MSVVIALLLAVVVAVVASGVEQSSSRARWAVWDIFMFPGGTVLAASHYSAPAAFKHLTNSDGPAAAFLWSLAVSTIAWTLPFAVALYVCLRAWRPKRSNQAMQRTAGRSAF